MYKCHGMKRKTFSPVFDLEWFFEAWISCLNLFLLRSGHIHCLLLWKTKLYLVHIIRSEPLILYFASRSSTSVHHFTIALESIITILCVSGLQCRKYDFTGRLITPQNLLHHKICFVGIFSKFSFLVALIKLFQKLYCVSEAKKLS